MCPVVGNEVIKIIHSHFPEVEFERRPPRKGDVLLTRAKTSDLKKLGWETTVDINSGINSCFKQLKQYKQGIGRSQFRNNNGVM